MKKVVSLLLSFIILLVPLVIVMTAIRVALTPLFISVEYILPGFPPDEYGFTTEDRLFWSNYSIDYLLGRISHQELIDTRLPDGTPLFNQRELDHMLDVRILTQQVLQIWQILLMILMVLIVLAFTTNMGRTLMESIKRGAMLTILIIFAVFLYLVINFNQLFTQFHQLFFEGGTWLFYLSDNLIRLFPLRFWRDIFLFIGGMSLLMSISLLFIPVQISRDTKK
ncbi:MAG: TIGR01906 family membrane protein [Chloroflexi bacterium]|nr:TIGR01906 family membrane protein [Chloroflexota bacterium]